MLVDTCRRADPKVFHQPRGQTILDSFMKLLSFFCQNVHMYATGI